MKHRNQQGYTLIELLLYVGMIGLLLGAVTVFFWTTSDARIKNQSISEVNDQGTFAMDALTQTVRNATSITAPAAAASGSQLTVTMPTSSLSPTVFSLSSGVLQIKEGTNAAVALTNSEIQVTSLTFTNLSRSGTKGVVQISMTLSRINGSGRNEYDYQRTFITSVGLRP